MYIFFKGKKIFCLVILNRVCVCVLEASSFSTKKKSQNPKSIVWLWWILSIYIENKNQWWGSIEIGLVDDDYNHQQQYYYTAFNDWFLIRNFFFVFVFSYKTTTLNRTHTQEKNENANTRLGKKTMKFRLCKFFIIIIFHHWCYAWIFFILFLEMSFWITCTHVK